MKICLYLRLKYQKMKRFLLLIAAFLFAVGLKAQEQSIPYSQADRDRMVRVEAQLEALNKRMDDQTSHNDSRFSGVNDRFDEVSKKIDRLEDKFDSYFMWGFGLVLMSIFGLMGFIIYDRRTTLAPVESKTERIIKALKDLAEKDPAIREALKNTALW